MVRYCAKPPLSMSSSLGGIGGGGRSFLYLVETTMSCLKPAFASAEVAIFAPCIQNNVCVVTVQRIQAVSESLPWGGKGGSLRRIARLNKVESVLVGALANPESQLLEQNIGCKEKGEAEERGADGCCG